MKRFLYGLVIIALAACNSSEDTKLRGVDWIVDYYTETGGSQVVTQTNYILNFTEAEYTYKMNVNTCFGTFSEKDGKEISFATAACTEACCDDDDALKILELIKSAETYELDNIELKLKGTAGEVLLFAN